MFNFQSESQYFVPMLQVLVTLGLVPIISYLRYLYLARAFACPAFPAAKPAIAKHTNNSLKVFMPLTFVCLAFGIAVAWQAQSNQSELFNWDNQAGLMVLFFIAAIPILHIALKQKQLYAILLQYTDTIRTASLKPIKWYQLLSPSLVLAVVAAQLLFVSTVFYFKQHPFPGFAGYANLLGALLLNGVFITTLFTIYRSNQFKAIKLPEHRQAIKSKLLDVNLVIWLIALLNLSLTLWISGTQWVEYKLLVQSLYLQFVIVTMAYTLTLPASVIKAADQP